MRKETRLWKLEWLLESVYHTEVQIDGKYYPARPMGYCPLPLRIKLVWGVWTGKYDVLEWPMGQ